MSEDILMRGIDDEFFEEKIRKVSLNQTNENSKRINDVNGGDIVGEFDHRVVNEPDLNSNPNESIAVYEVGDGERSAKFIMQNDEFRVRNPKYRNEHGQKWVNEAKSYLLSSVAKPH